MAVKVPSPFSCSESPVPNVISNEAWGVGGLDSPPKDKVPSVSCVKSLSVSRISSRCARMPSLSLIALGTFRYLLTHAVPLGMD